MWEVKETGGTPCTCPSCRPLGMGALSPAAAGRWGTATAGVQSLPGLGESRPHSWGQKRLRQVWGTRRGTQLEGARDSQLGSQNSVGESGPCPEDSVQSRVNFRPSRPPGGWERVNYYLLTRVANESG